MTIKLILSIAIAWLLAKLIKAVIDCIREKRINWKVIFYDGGMPSAHTAAIISTVTAIYFETGLSAVLALSILVALIVINDAMKVRWVTEEQSRAINKLTKGMKGFTKMDEHVGHKPIEVIFGLILGIVIPVLMYLVF